MEAVVTVLTRVTNSFGIKDLDSSCSDDPLSHSSNSSSEPPLFTEDKVVDTLAHLSDKNPWGYPDCTEWTAAGSAGQASCREVR